MYLYAGRFAALSPFRSFAADSGASSSVADGDRAQRLCESAFTIGPSKGVHTTRPPDVAMSSTSVDTQVVNRSQEGSSCEPVGSVGPILCLTYHRTECLAWQAQDHVMRRNRYRYRGLLLRRGSCDRRCCCGKEGWLVARKPHVRTCGADCDPCSCILTSYARPPPSTHRKIHHSPWRPSGP